MTSELKSSGSIEELFIGRPKIYAYKVVDTGTGERKTVCKVRRITLNYKTSRLVKFDVISDMILKEGPVVTVHTEHKVQRKRKRGGIVPIITEPEDKMYRISFFKRKRLSDDTSIPFGYK